MLQSESKLNNDTKFHNQTEVAVTIEAARRLINEYDQVRETHCLQNFTARKSEYVRICV